MQSSLIFANLSWFGTVQHQQRPTAAIVMHVQISLIYANVTEDDILLRSELYFKSRINGDKFRVFYTLDKPPEGATLSCVFVLFMSS
jgi:hypothetical protein